MRGDETCVSSSDSQTGQPHLLASVSLISDEGDLAGLEISNFEVWRRTDGLPGISITVPSRSFAKPGGGRYLFVRDARHGAGVVVEIRRRIFAEIQSCYPHLSRTAGGAAPLLAAAEPRLGKAVSGAQR
jgi:hypothetical protein